MAEDPDNALVWIRQGVAQTDMPTRQLLASAQVDGADVVSSTELDPAKITQVVVDDLGQLVLSRDVSVALTSSHQIQMTSDPTLSTLAIPNLLENAILAS